MPPLSKEAEYYVLKRLQESPDRRWTLMRGGRTLFSVVVSVLHLLLVILAVIMLCLSVFNHVYVEKKINLFDGLDINKTMAFFIVLCVFLMVVHGCASGFFYKLKSCTELNNNWFRGKCLLSVCQPVKSYFMPRGLGIAFILCLYLYIFCFCFGRCIFCTWSCRIRIFLYKCIWPINGTLTGFTTLGQSRSGSNANEGVLYTTQIRRTKALPSDSV